MQKKSLISMNAIKAKHSDPYTFEKVKRSILERMRLLLSCAGGFSEKYKINHVMIKPVFRVSDQVRHKLGCTATEDGLRLET